MHIINIILNEFDENKIKYCHFKSNQHLNESFEGIADFDLLVDYKRSSDCERILLKNNCKRFEPEYIGSYPGVVNWIAFDSETGKIFHLHIHYQLVSGISLVKEYVLPWREIILDSAIRSDKYKIYTANPNVEILLLLCRIVIKMGILDKAKAILNIYKLSNDMQKEYDYLKNLINKSELDFFSRKMFSSGHAEILTKIILNSETIKAKELRLLQLIIRKELKIYKRMNSLSALIQNKTFRVIDLKNKFLSRKLNKNYITKKITPSGGKIIAFIGADGSGKTTLSEEITSWLSYKIEAKKFYMGEGDGKVPLIVNAVKKCYSLFFKKLKSNRGKESDKYYFKKESTVIFSDPINFLKKYIHALMIFIIVKNNRKKILSMQRYRMNGGFSILDRFPQLQYEGMNDGPKLDRYAKELNSIFLRKLAKKEKELISIVNEIYPDIIFRLNISPETSMKRKPGDQIDYDTIKAKIDACKAIEFKKTKVIDIDAEQSLEHILLFVKRIIWSEI